MKPKAWKPVVASLAVLIAVGAYLPALAAPRAVAGLALRVNPAVTLTLDERNTVIAAEGLDAPGEALLAGLDVTNKELSEALRAIADALREAGVLENERRVLIALHPVGDQVVEETELTALADAVRRTLGGYLTEHGLTAEVASIVLTAELADAFRVAGLFPADYVDLVVAVGAPAALEALGLQRELGLDPELFKEEFGTIAAALLDMTEAGIAGGNALAILRGALAADPKMEELATIAAAMIDLHEVGATQEDMMAVFGLLEEQLAHGVERALLLEEITTITAAKADLLEAGIPAEAALAVLRTALAADPSLEESTTITAAFIDMHEAGISLEIAEAVLQLALAADATLEEITTVTAAFIDLKEKGMSEAEALALLRGAVAVTHLEIDDALDALLGDNDEDDDDNAAADPDDDNNDADDDAGGDNGDNDEDEDDNDDDDDDDNGDDDADGNDND